MKALRMTKAEVEAHQRRVSGFVTHKDMGVKVGPMIEVRDGVAQTIRPESKIERRFSQQLGDRPYLPAHVRDYFFIEGRDFELDFAWPALRFGVSVEGMAHRVKRQFNVDLEKHALGLIAGWRILRVGGQDIRDGRAIEWAETIIKRLRARK